MRAASTLTAIGSALLFAVTSAHGLGFGRVVNATQLGQPLNFAAALRLDADESLERECVSAEVQSGDNKLASAQVRATLEGLGTERNVRVTTLSIIDEPVVTISVTVGCTSKITRKFVAFIDPPLINLPDSSATPAALPPQRSDTQVAPLVTLVEGEKPAPAPPSEAAPRPPPPERAPTPRVRQRVAPPPRAVAAPQPVEANAAPRPPRSSTPRLSAGGSRVAAAPAGPRLKLEAPPSKAATAASAASMPLPAPASPTPPIAAASAPELAGAAVAGSKETDQLSAERERIRLLEEGLNKLRTDSQATQTTIATLQAKLKEAESQRFSNPLVYGLAWLSALLALAMLGLLWRQARVRNSSQWWTAPAPTQTAQPPSPGAPSTLAEPRRLPPSSGHGTLPPHPLDDPTTGAGSFGVPTVIEEDVAVRAAGYAAPQAPAGFVPTQPPPAMPAAPEPVRELSVEELIDLEQQAEFFVVLGQDEAAIELLMSHVRTDGGISPLPYLKLLEIYRRRGESDAYERIRDRFNRRFNAYAPDWDADMQHGRTLEDYPETTNRLQELWATPTRAMETLDASLFRRNKTDETFDLPAYRELLFLYSVSRDLAEHGGSAPLADVDVLLPLSDDPNAEPISRLSATTRPGDFKSSDMMTQPLDLDVSFPSEHPGEAAKDSGFIDFDLNEPYQPKKKP
jgi:pilus assembly protein FimV